MLIVKHGEGAARMDRHEYPDRVTLCEDGQYRWSYILSREQSRWQYRQMIRITSLVAAVITVILLIMGNGSLTRDPSIALFFLCVPVVSIVGLPALIGWFFMRGGERYRYEMDEQYIRQKNATKGGDAWIRLRKVESVSVDGDVFSIKAGISTYRVHVPHEDVPFVREYISDHG